MRIHDYLIEATYIVGDTVRVEPTLRVQFEDIEQATVYGLYWHPQAATVTVTEMQL